MNTTTSQRNNDQIGYSHRVAVVIGLVLSLSLGFLDLLISMVSGRTGLDSFLSVLPFLSAAVGVSFVIYLIIWFLVAIHVGRLFKFEAFPLAWIFTTINSLRIMAAGSEILRLCISQIAIFGAAFTQRQLVVAEARHLLVISK